MSMPPLDAPPAPPLPLTNENNAPQNPWATDAIAGKFANDRFFLNQKILSLGNKYHVYDEHNMPLFFVDRPLLRLKMEFTVYEDDSKRRPLLSVTQDSVFTVINFKFIVRDANGQVIGVMKRQGWQSMLRRTWMIEDAQERLIATATEDSMGKAIARRIFAATDLEIINALIRTNFYLYKPDGTTKFGEFLRKLALTDKYEMNLQADPERTFDRRLAVALAVLLDNAERR
ncbi:MAG: hypothetical protein H7145_15610 [Akkermansiaceae bacterium]|nr:hypothetical protein [Armatimonadota bacterium]